MPAKPPPLRATHCDTTASDLSATGPNWPPRVLGFLAVCYAVIAVAFTWPLAKAPGSTIEIGWGDPLLISYVLNWGAHALLHHPGAVFDASFLYPSPNSLSYSDQLLSVSWPLAPLSLVGNPLLFHNLAVFLSYVLSALAFAAYLREVGCGPAVSGLGGLLFGFNPWRFGQFGHPQLGFLWWIPLTLLLLERWWRKPTPGKALLLGVCLAGALLASIYLGIYFALYLVIYVLVRAAGGWRNLTHIGAARAARDVLLAVGVCVLLVAPSARAYRSAEADVSGRLLPLDRIANRGADLLDYVNPPPFSLLWHRWSRNQHPYSDTPWEMHVYPGALALLSPLLVLPALALRPRRDVLEGPPVAILASGALLFLIAAGTKIHIAGRDTGIATPYRLLFEALPGFRALRVPARAAIFPAASAAALLAICLEALRTPLRRWWKPVVATAILASLVDQFPGNLRYVVPLQYDRLRNAMRATDGQTSAAGVDLLLPVEACNFAGPLASAPRFRRMINGNTGHRPLASERIMANLSVPLFTEGQAKMALELGVNRILIDSRLAASELGPSVLQSLRLKLCRARSAGDWDGIEVLLVDCARPSLPASANR